MPSGNGGRSGVPSTSWRVGHRHLPVAAGERAVRIDHLRLVAKSEHGQTKSKVLPAPKRSHYGLRNGLDAKAVRYR